MKKKQQLFSVYVVLFALVCWNSNGKDTSIDRYQLVNRHNVVINSVDPLSPLSVGNGNFAFTVDVTGLQTFESFYYKKGIPLETLSSWAWHTFPNTENFKLEKAMKDYNFHGRNIPYASLEKSSDGQYFRMNPNPIPLGQISMADGNNIPLDTAAIKNINQKLNLWEGIVYSQYTLHGQQVKVETSCNSKLDMVVVKIQSTLLKDDKLKPRFHFPYAYIMSGKNKPPFDWAHPDAHKTSIVSQTSNTVVLKRNIDDSTYYVTIRWEGSAKLTEKASHEYVLEGGKSDKLIFSCTFSHSLLGKNIPNYKTSKLESIAAWKNYWTKGGAIDLAGSTDSRASELERRIVLSEYLVKINYSGNFPPQETGLTHISFYGKHNSEMYWWHTAHFCQWGRPELLENSLQWYLSIVPKAKAEAKKEGFEGIRWPKMTGPDGEPSPGGINPFIIWNQPNTIMLAELLYRAHPNKATLDKYSEMVFESAKFLASYAFYDETTKRYILGPPIKSVNEKNDENETQNPSYELASWYYGLKVAQDWRVRLGLPRVAKWDEVMDKLSPLAVSDGKYLELETEPNMYTGGGAMSSSMLMSYGLLPQTKMIDTAIMRRTFDKIYERGGLKAFISWAMGRGALTAARLGEQKMAVDILCNDAPNTIFLKNGHVRRAKDPNGSPAYLPVNSSFLAAVALMAAGWDGAPNINAPGFPQDGTWKVKSEGLVKLP
jgi:hypothetical protein